MKAATINGLGRVEANYLSRINVRLREIKAIHKDIAKERAEGRKVSADIRRQHKEIQAILTRVEAAL